MKSSPAKSLLASLLIAAAAFPALADDPATNPSTTPTPAPRKRPAQPAPSTTPAKPADKPADQPTDTPADKPTTPVKPAPTKPTPSKPAPTKPAPTTPAPTTKPVKPAAPLPMVRKELVEPGPYLERSSPKDLIFRARVQIGGISWTELVADPNGGPAKQIPRKEEIAFDQAWIVYPMLKQTGTSRMPEETWKGSFRIGDAIATEEIQVMNGLQSGSRYAKMALGAGRAKTFTFEIEQRTTAYRVKYYDVEADQVAWPKGGWPAAAASCFTPQMYVDYWPDDTTGMAPTAGSASAVGAMVDGWLANANLASPRDASPNQLAKFIAGQVVRNFQVVNQVFITNRVNAIEGANVLPLTEVVRTGRGSSFDICHILVACYRHVGLPARLVVGYQKEGTGKTFLTAKGASAQIRPYVEWCLFNEDFEPTKASVNWVPVDIVDMRRTMPNPPSLDKPWRCFGSFDDTNECFPFTFHLHPPTSVRAYGSPGFWGWMVAPTQPLSAEQSLSFTVTSAPNIGGQPTRTDGD